MYKVLLIGNPNVGKSTLFNSLTKSNEHTGNFHGVTVDEKAKDIKIGNNIFTVVDLPGIYSLNTFTGEEDVSKKHILNSKSSINLVLADCNSLKKNLYLCLQLSELGINYKLLINNYELFVKNGNKLNLENLKSTLNIDIEIINAKKTKASKELFSFGLKKPKLKYLEPYISEIQQKTNLSKDKIILSINGCDADLTTEQEQIIKDYMPKIVSERYNFIESIFIDSLILKKNFIYGYSKADKFILNPIVAALGFLLFFFVSIYVIFFLIGPLIGDFLFLLLNYIVFQPVTNFLIQVTDNIWVIEFVSNGVLSAFSTVLTFLPQICLMFVFITILEDSGIISRFAYVMDDLLTTIGLNGKAVYIMLLGLGCNTMSAAVTKSLNGKNLKHKSAIINPYISCMARLPVYILISTAFFSKYAYLSIVDAD